MTRRCIHRPGAMPRALDSEAALISVVAETPGVIGYVEPFLLARHVKARITKNNI